MSCLSPEDMVFEIDLECHDSVQIMESGHRPKCCDLEIVAIDFTSLDAMQAGKDGKTATSADGDAKSQAQIQREEDTLRVYRRNPDKILSHSEVSQQNHRLLQACIDKVCTFC